MPRFKRSMTVAAATGLIVCLAQAGAAQADVGDLVIAQYDGHDQLLCTQDYVLLNLTGPEEITDPDCPGAMSANLENLSLEPIQYSNGTSSGQVGTLSDKQIPTGVPDYPELCFYVGTGSVSGIISCGSEADDS